MESLKYGKVKMSTRSKWVKMSNSFKKGSDDKLDDKFGKS